MLWVLTARSIPETTLSSNEEAVMPRTPEQLLTDTLCGSAAAREGLMRCLLPVILARVGRAVLRHGPASVHNNLRMEVEDLVQEICLSLFTDDCRILRSWSSSHGVPLAGFVGMVSRRRTISLLRRRWQTETPVPEELLAQAAGAAALEDDLIRRDLLMRAFADVESAQKPLGRQMLRMLFIEGLPVSEIEAQTGRSAAAVYQWRHRLIGALQQVLQQLKAEAGDE